MKMQINLSSKDIQSTDQTHIPNGNLVFSREGIRLHSIKTSETFVIFINALLQQDIKKLFLLTIFA